MNFLERGSILYISSADVSLGNGPGVNEQEFILALDHAVGPRAHYLIPQPSRPVPGLPVARCTFSRAHKQHHPLLYPAHILSQLRTAHALLRRQKFNLVVYRLDVLPLAPLLLSKAHAVPYAIKTLGQGALMVLDHKGGWLGKSLSGLNRRMFRAVVDGAQVADTDSHLHVQELKSRLGLREDKIIRIDNAANTDRFYPAGTAEARKKLGLSARDPIVGYIGNRPWERGALQLIEAAPLLLEKYPDLGLVILGGGAGIPGLVNRAAELGILDRCHFGGQIPLEQVPAYIHSIDVGVSLSLHEDRKVNAELKVRQYLACGKPVVISPGSNRFVIEENFGSVVQPRDIPAIAASLDEWLSMSPDARQRFADRSSAYIRQHLSMKAAVTRRLVLWSDRLQASRTKPETAGLTP